MLKPLKILILFKNLLKNGMKTRVRVIYVINGIKIFHTQYYLFSTLLFYIERFLHIYHTLKKFLLKYYL